MKYFILII